MQQQRTFDVFCLCLLSFLSFWFSFHLSGGIPESFYELYDYWFDADISRVLVNIDAGSNEAWRNHTHPLFAAFFKPLAFLFSLAQVGPVMFGRVLIGISAVVTTGSVFLTLRALGFSPISRLLGASMFICSGAFVFWWSVLETFPVGGAFIAVLILALSINLKSKLFWVFATPFTLGLTVTNWLICIVGVFLSFHWKKSFQLLALGVLTSVAIYGASTQVLKTDTQGMPGRLLQEQRFLFHPESINEVPEYAKIYTKRAVWFFCSPAVVAQGRVGPAQFKSEKYNGIWYGGFRYSYRGYIALLCWFILLFKGSSNLLLQKKKSKVSLTIFLFLLFQLALHLVYGKHPFLYSSHWAPCLVILAAFSLSGSRKRLFQVVALVFCVFALWSNLETFHRSIELVLEANR